MCTVCTVCTQCAPVCTVCTGVHNGEIADEEEVEDGEDVEEEVNAEVDAAPTEALTVQQHALLRPGLARIKDHCT